MDSARLNRFEWLKAVMQAEGLTPTAKNVAAALAVRYYNDDTAQLNPSRSTIADFLKVHRDTVKRVLRELKNAGWLLILGNGANGIAPSFRFVSPGKVVQLRAERAEKTVTPDAKKGGDKSSPKPERGRGNLWRQRGQIVPPHYKEEQSLEQKAPPSGERPSPQLQFKIGRGTPSEDAWNRWLQRRGFPPLASLDQRLDDGWNLPATLPPNDPATIDWRIAEKWAAWAFWRMEDRKIA